jgi:hypothetical protein
MSAHAPDPNSNNDTPARRRFIARHYEVAFSRLSVVGCRSFEVLLPRRAGEGGGRPDGRPCCLFASRLDAGGPAGRMPALRNGVRATGHFEALLPRRAGEGGRRPDEGPFYLFASRLEAGGPAGRMPALRKRTPRAPLALRSSLRSTINEQRSTPVQPTINRPSETTSAPGHPARSPDSAVARRTSQRCSRSCSSSRTDARARSPCPDPRWG